MQSHQGGDCYKDVKRLLGFLLPICDLGKLLSFSASFPSLHSDVSWAVELSTRHCGFLMAQQDASGGRSCGDTDSEGAGI